MKTGAPAQDQVRPRTCGFRFSLTDGLILAAGVMSALLFWRIPQGMGVLPAFTILHFFLFCNVFRIRRQLELLWTAWFLAMAGVCVLVGRSFWIAYAASLPVTIGLVGFAVTRPWYHGIFARRFNPRYVDRYMAGEDFAL